MYVVNPSTKSIVEQKVQSQMLALHKEVSTKLWAHCSNIMGRK